MKTRIKTKVKRKSKPNLYDAIRCQQKLGGLVGPPKRRVGAGRASTIKGPIRDLKGGKRSADEVGNQFGVSSQYVRHLWRQVVA